VAVEQSTTSLSTTYEGRQIHAFISEWNLNDKSFWTDNGVQYTVVEILDIDTKRILIQSVLYSTVIVAYMRPKQDFIGQV